MSDALAARARAARRRAASTSTALELEGELRGHPWIVASKGRIGFSWSDLRRYAPEARRAGPGLLARRSTDARLARPAGSSESLVPVHPWQWDHRIQTLYAGDIARGRIRFLGERDGR